jgi:hypothetical protein
LGRANAELAAVQAVMKALPKTKPQEDLQAQIRVQAQAPKARIAEPGLPELPRLKADIRWRGCL